VDSSFTPAAQIIISIIPIVGIAFAATLIFFALLWKHSENKASIQRGTYKPAHFNLKVFSLLTGLCLIGVGTVLTVMFLILEPLSWSLLGGLIPLVLGLMLIIFYKANPKFKQETDEQRD